MKKHALALVDQKALQPVDVTAEILDFPTESPFDPQTSIETTFLVWLKCDAPADLTEREKKALGSLPFEESPAPWEYFAALNQLRNRNMHVVGTVAWDHVVLGLHISKGANGVCYWVHFRGKGGKGEDHRIGSFADFTVEQARDEARRFLAAVRNGTLPDTPGNQGRAKSALTSTRKPRK